MDLRYHHEMMWYACQEAERRLGDNKIASPTAYYPYLVCGSWMNDMKQSTIFTDFIKSAATPDAAFNANPAIQGAFKVLWIEELKELLARMDAVPGDAAGAAAAFRKLFPDALKEDTTDTASFGNYCRFDHLDVLQANAANEHDGWDKTHPFVSKTIKSTFNYEKYSMLVSTIGVDPDKRLATPKVIALGRMLHTCEDFWAHSNHVELLLWTLAHRGKLRTSILEELNGRCQFPSEAEEIRPYCPLPTSRDRKALLGLDADSPLYPVLWYGEAPDATPLTSCRFYLKDTAYSLLMLYAKFLQRISDAPVDNSTFDLAMAVFNFPGRTAVMASLEIYQTFASVFQELGKAARSFLANELLTIGNNQSNAMVKEACEATAAIVLNYDSAEAGEWARAGRLKYVAWTLLKGMSNELIGQDAGKPVLPHHSLLCKDYLPAFPGDTLRFRLACMFATEVTTQFLMLHFSKADVTEEAYWNLVSRYFIHPAAQLAPDRRLSPVRPLLDEERLNTWMADGLLGNWSALVKGGNVIRV